MIKAVLFDFYGVFLPDSYNVWLARHQLKREGIFADVITKLDEDAIGETEFLRVLSVEIGRPVSSEEIHNATPILDDQLVRLVQSLKPHYKLGLLSNAPISLRGKLETLGIDVLFDEIIISSEIGCTKPSREAFMVAVDKLGVEPKETLFIDDNPANIEAAGKLGMQVVHYTSFNSAKEQLTDALNTPLG